MATANIGLPQWGLTCFYDAFVVNQSAVLRLNFCTKIPPLRQAAKRCGLCRETKTCKIRNKIVYLDKKHNDMRTLNISISDLELNKFGIKKDNLTFTEFVELISRELMRQNLDKCVELAEKYGLSSMTMDEINEEVKAVRNAKNCH